MFMLNLNRFLKKRIKTRDDLPSLLNSPSPKIAEIGVEYGGYTDLYYPKVRNGEIYLVDSWETTPEILLFNFKPGQVEEGEIRIREKYADKINVRIMKSRSFDAAKSFPDLYFDWVYLDADHRYEAVRRDIAAWWPKIKIGGIISGHDFDPDPADSNYEKYGVARAVRERFARKYALTRERYYKSWYVRKTGGGYG